MLRLRQVLVPTVRRRLEVAGLHRAVPSAVMGLPRGAVTGAISACSVRAVAHRSLSVLASAGAELAVPASLQARRLSSSAGPAGGEIEQLPEALKRMLSLDNASQVIAALLRRHSCGTWYGLGTVLTSCVCTRWLADGEEQACNQAGCKGLSAAPW